MADINTVKKMRYYQYLDLINFLAIRMTKKCSIFAFSNKKGEENSLPGEQ